MHRRRSPLHRRNLILATLAAVLSICGCSGGGDAPPASGDTPATASPEERAAATVHEAVEICRAEDWSGATALFAYDGDDDSRKWKDTWNAADETERLRAKAGCDELLYGGFPETDSAYELGGLSVEEESEGTWYVQEVSFPEAPEAGPIVVALLDVDGRLVIGDVD